MRSRRHLLTRLASVAGTAGLAGCSRSILPTAGTELGLPPNPRELPERQHAQEAFLRTDGDGNPITPRHHVVFLLELDAPPTAESARTVERAMRTVEAAYEWRPEGLFHMLAWGPSYFETLDMLDAAPVRRPENLSRTDDPRLEDFEAALVLSSDVPSRLRTVERAMFGPASSLGGKPVNHRLGEVFAVAGKRTGFIGKGLPAEHTDAEGIPDDASIPEHAPMFMGFRSGLSETQATEDAVTIEGGILDDRFAGGTTMALTHFTQSLSEWFQGLGDADRAAQMFSPEFSPRDVTDFADSVPFSDQVREHATEHDIVGHHEKVAQARENGKPLLLRRDFNTTDGGRAGVHFLSLQESIDDFIETRRAMNGWYVRDDSEAITDRDNNGILEFITEVATANFYVPPRADRSFPGFRVEE
ncbi:hypothetical protein BRC86_12205 [Halobacteriales archaeon QS_3_64_16]|nr:MAG: hypothetical protein BRC86_12205 [Halobacteriales archaeon QS_3_64_16]